MVAVVIAIHYDHRLIDCRQAADTHIVGAVAVAKSCGAVFQHCCWGRMKVQERQVRAAVANDYWRIANEVARRVRPVQIPQMRVSHLWGWNYVRDAALVPEVSLQITSPRSECLFVQNCILREKQQLLRHWQHL